MSQVFEEHSRHVHDVNAEIEEPVVRFGILGQGEVIEVEGSAFLEAGAEDGEDMCWVGRWGGEEEVEEVGGEAHAGVVEKGHGDFEAFGGDFG